MQLTPTETRVLATLVEKDRTTPDSYPLSTNALTAACNQKTSRDPVMSVTSSEVDEAMLELRAREMARTVRGAGARAYKHRHTLDAALGLDDDELACLAVLMLRGPQTPGELRSRTERYVATESPASVERALRRLASRAEPLVVNLGRGPGQSQDRWMQLLGESDPDRRVADPAGGDRSPSPLVAGSAPSAGRADELADVRAEVAELRALVQRICDELGIDRSA